MPFLYPELCAIKSDNRYFVMGYGFNNESAITFSSNRATMAECSVRCYPASLQRDGVPLDQQRIK